MNSTDHREPLRKPQISRFMFAMFDVLGFSRWLESVGLQAVLDAYHLLIERVVVRPNEKGGLSMGAACTNTMQNGDGLRHS
jgi:hypothetical protein